MPRVRITAIPKFKGGGNTDMDLSPYQLQQLQKLQGTQNYLSSITPQQVIQNQYPAPYSPMMYNGDRNTAQQNQQNYYTQQKMKQNFGHDINNDVPISPRNRRVGETMKNQADMLTNYLPLVDAPFSIANQLAETTGKKAVSKVATENAAKMTDWLDYQKRPFPDYSKMSTNDIIDYHKQDFINNPPPPIPQQVVDNYKNSTKWLNDQLTNDPNFLKKLEFIPSDRKRFTPFVNKWNDAFIDPYKTKFTQNIIPDKAIGDYNAINPNTVYDRSNNGLSGNFDAEWWKPGQEANVQKYLQNYQNKSPQSILDVGQGNSMGSTNGELWDPYRLNKYGGNVMPRVRITGLPTMAYGGPTADSGVRNGFPNRAISTAWDWRTGTSFNENTPYAQKRILPDAPEGMGDITVEKKEQVIGDFDGDGQQELMGVNTGTHASGNDQDINVPPSAFVYSDTKALKIKDPAVLAKFGSKKPATPAALAKQYDLQKYKAIIDNPHSDQLSRKTAQMMYDNSLNKLNALADHQEQMKGNMQQQKMMKFGGQLPKAKEGINWNNPLYGQPPQQDEYIPPYTEGVSPDYRNNWNNFNNYLSSRRLEGYKPLNYNPNVSQALMQDYNQEYPDQSINTPTVSRVQRDFIQNGNNGKPISRNDNWIGSITSTYNYPDANNLQSNNPPVQNVGTLSSDNGDPNANLVPYAPTSGPLTGQQGSAQQAKVQGQRAKFPQFNGIDANTLGDLAFGLKAATTRNYAPWEAPTRAVLPSVTFESDQPIRNAITEQANGISNNLGLSANSRAARAAYQGLQGQVGAQASQAVGEVGNRNVNIANNAQMQSSQIMNQQQEMERQRLTRLYDKGVIGSQQYKNSLDNLSNELVGRAAERQDSRYKNAWDDIRSRYFTHDAQGMPVFKSDYAKAMYEKELLGMHPGDNTGSISTAWKQAYDNAKAQGIPDDSAKDLADKLSGVDAKRRTKYDENSEMKGYSTTQQFGGPIMKMGGIPQYSIGGDYLPSVASIDTVQPVVHSGQPSAQPPGRYSDTAPEKGQAPLYAGKFFASKGVPLYVSAAIVGNIAQESGFNPNATNPTTGAFGLGQWLGNRKRNYMKAAMNAGVDPGNMDFQLNYLISEPGESQKALKATMNTTDPQSAAITWADTYERMGKAEANYPKRIKVAQGVYNALSGQSPMQYGGPVRVKITALPS